MLTGHSRSKGLAVFLIVFIGGYLFFFTSNLWMPSSGNAKRLTALYQQMEFSQRTVVINRWDYAEGEAVMEVELEITNPTFDGNDSYEFSAVDSVHGRIEVAVALAEPDFIVLRMVVPKRWSEISLRMRLPQNVASGGGDETLRMYTNVKDVHRVESLPVKTRTGYYIQRIDSQIAGYEDAIELLLEDINQQEVYQENIKNETDRLLSNKKYQTDEETEKTDQLIRSAQQKLEESRNKVTEDETEILEYREKITKAREKQEMYQEE